MGVFFSNKFKEYRISKIGNRSFATEKIQDLKSCVKDYVGIIMNPTCNPEDTQWKEDTQLLRKKVIDSELEENQVEKVFLELVCSHLHNRDWNKLQNLVGCEFRSLRVNFNTSKFKEMFKRQEMAVFFLTFYDSIIDNLATHELDDCKKELEGI